MWSNLAMREILRVLHLHQQSSMKISTNAHSNERRHKQLNAWQRPRCTAALSESSLLLTRNAFSAWVGISYTQHFLLSWLEWLTVPGIERGTPGSYHTYDTSVHRPLHSATETPQIHIQIIIIYNTNIKSIHELRVKNLANALIRFLSCIDLLVFMLSADELIKCSESCCYKSLHYLNLVFILSESSCAVIKKMML